jgi:putative flavoprotein involved in K+ transport
MNITPLRLGGVPLHPVSVLGRYLPLRWQDANARVVQRLAFGDLARLSYPRPAAGAFTRAAADGVTVAVDDGFVRALKAGRVIMKPAIDRFDGPQACFTDGTSCAPDAVICATGYRPGLEQLPRGRGRLHRAVRRDRGGARRPRGVSRHHARRR